MATPGKPIPEGFHAVTPHLITNDTGAAIEFYKKAFGAEEVFRMPGPDGKSVTHAEIQIGGSRIMLAQEGPHSKHWVSPKSLKGTTVTIHLYVNDVDAVFGQATGAGAEVSMPVTDTFWGDRFGKVTDPFGHEWSIATHKLDLTPEEMKEGAEEFFKNMAGGCEQ